MIIKKNIKLITQFYLLIFSGTILIIFYGCTPKIALYKGANIISKQIFYKDDNNIAHFYFPDNLYYDNKTDLILFGKKCDNPYTDVCYISNEGVLKTIINLNYNCLVKIIPIDIENDGIYEFYTFSGSTVFLFNNFGRIIWKFSRNDFNNKFDTQIGIGDFDGDGIIEFVAAFLKENDYTVHILDYKGNLKNYFVLSDSQFDFNHMKVFDTNGDSISEIVCNGMGGIHIYNSLGWHINNFDLDWGWHLSILYDQNKKPILSGPGGKSVLLTDLNGKIIDEIHLSKNDLYFLRNPPIPIKFKGVSTESYIAATRVIPYVYDRSYFYIFNPAGSLIYEEVFPGRIDGYYVIFDPKIKKEYLLVSMHGTIWSYKLN